MNMKVLKYISKVLKCSDVNYAEFPVELRGIPVEEIDPSDVSSLIAKILSEHEHGYIAVCTENESVVSLVNALNLNFANNKVISIFNGKIDVSAIENEISERCLTDKNNMSYYPESTKYCGIFHDGDRILIKTDSVADENSNILYSKNATSWGVVLNEKYKFQNIIGTADNCLEKFTLKDKARIFEEMVMKGIRSFSDILVLDNEKEYFFLSIDQAKMCSKNDIYSAYLELFAGIKSDCEFGDIIITLSGTPLPCTLVDDINTIVTHRYISQKVKLPSAETMLNSMARLQIAE